MITPNFTEAAFLLDEPCRRSVDVATLRDWLQRLAAIGPRCVVITSVPLHPSNRLEGNGTDRRLSVVAYDSESHRFWRVDAPLLPATAMNWRLKRRAGILYRNNSCQIKRGYFGNEAASLLLTDNVTWICIRHCYTFPNFMLPRIYFITIRIFG